MASRFGDVYYSRAGGLGEARHVFLGGCNLPGDWKNGETFVICELGFGTGLNFLATWDAWRKSRVRNARLHYIAVEGFPLLQNELSETLLEWPELRALVRGLARVYPQPQRGFQRVFPKIPGDDESNVVTLTLLFGDVLDMLAQLEARVDAWFLDGFTPDKNPKMWRDAVFEQLARLSHTKNGGSRLATYTVAGHVRRGLDAVGFENTRTAGFGDKREMLRGRFRGNPNSKPALQPWFAPPPSSHGARGHAAIIGAGVAGASTANALNRRGWTTTLIDRRAAIADETSGNPIGILMPRLTAGESIDGRFYSAAWRAVLETFDDLSETSSALLRDRCGVLHLATDETEADRQKAIVAANVLPEPLLFHVSAREASDIAGYKLPYSALYFPQGGWVRPREYCAALCQHSRTLLGVDVGGVKHTGGYWEVTDKAGRVCTRADVIVLANGLGVSAVPFTAWLPLAARRGQITAVPPTAQSAPLRSVLSFGPYMTPVHRGAHFVGATFDHVDATLDDKPIQTTSDDDARNIDAINNALPNLLDEGQTIAASSPRRSSLHLARPPSYRWAGSRPKCVPA